MAGVWVSQGADAQAKAKLGASGGAYPVVVALWTNSGITPAPATVLSSLTLDSTYYFASINAGWSFSTPDVNGIVTASQAWSFNFASGDAGTIYYGYAFIDAFPLSASVLYYAELLPTPFTVPVGGGGYFLSTAQTMGQCP